MQLGPADAREWLGLLLRPGVPGVLLRAAALLGLFAALWLPQTLAAASLANGKGAGPRREPVSAVDVRLPDRAALEALARAGYDLDSVTADRATLYADPDELDALRAAGYELTVRPAPAAFAPGLENLGLGSYNNYTGMTAMLDGYATAYTSICRKVSLGKSVQGRDLWAMKITDNPDVEEDEPEVKYVATIHGNEPLGTEMCLYLIDYLLNGYATNSPRAVSLVDSTEIWIVPMVNPDGRSASSPSRYNADGIDLNRDFPEGSATNLGNLLYGPPVSTNGLEPEVRCVMTWIAAHSFTHGGNFHTGSLVANYPYDNDNMGSVDSPTPDDALMASLARLYASNNPSMWANNSAPFVNGVVNGAAWYAVNGGMQDWNYRVAGCNDMTFEISNSQWPQPPANQLATYWSQNRESMLAYLEAAGTGVRGLVRDAQSGLPVRAAVRVEGFHHLVFTDPDVGDYHRMLLPGTYTLWCYAPGYAPQRITGVTVGAGAATRVDVALQRVSSRLAAKVSFQPAAASVPTGYVADVGAAYGARGSNYTYGWNAAIASNVVVRNAGRSQDLRYDSLARMQAGGAYSWEMAVPNGPYSVLVAAGDAASTTGSYRVLAEDVLLVSGAPTGSNRWLEGVGTVTVTDGKLTLSNGAGATNNSLAFVEINALEPASLDQWRAVYFAATNDAGNAADLADPDGDGRPNLLEYAVGSCPTNADAQGRLACAIASTNGADWFAVGFLRYTNAQDITWIVQANADLRTNAWVGIATNRAGSGWGGSAPAAEVGVASNQAQVTVRDVGPVSDFSNRFFRLLITKP